MKTRKTTKKPSKVIPDNIVTYSQTQWSIDGVPFDMEMIDQLASESEIFKKTFLYRMWQSKIRTDVITAIVKDSKDFKDVEREKALLIALDRLDNMMSDIIKKHKAIVKNKN